MRSPDRWGPSVSDTEEEARGCGRNGDGLGWLRFWAAREVDSARERVREGEDKKGGGLGRIWRWAKVKVGSALSKEMTFDFLGKV